MKCRIDMKKIIMSGIIPLIILSVTSLPLMQAGVARAARATWTIMVYVVGDNDLEGYALVDLNEMEEGLKTYGPGSAVRVIAYVDRSGDDYEFQSNNPLVREVAQANPDWSGAKIFEVVHDASPRIASKLLKDLGEQDSGDPRTLATFIKFAMSYAPAQHYALVIWDHGSGPGIVGVDFDNGRDYLTLRELSYALSIAGAKVDVIGFDACLMGTIETAYELRNYASYLVASEESEPADGWPYDTILSQLSSNPSMSARDLALTMAKNYIAYYREEGIESGEVVTQAVLDLSVLRSPTYVSTFKAFAQAAARRPNAFRTARNYARQFTSYQVDLKTLAERAATAGAGQAASQILAILSKLIIYSGTYGASSGANGITIHYPLRYHKEAYLRIASFPKDTGWGDALDVLVNIAPQINVQVPQQPTQNETQVPTGSVQLFTDIGISLKSATMGAAGGVDLDGDGADEFAVYAIGYDGAGTYYLLLSITEYVGGKGLVEAYVSQLDKGDELSDGSPPFLTAGVMDDDYDGDNVSEIFAVYSYVDTDNGDFYTSIDRYDYEEGDVNHDYNTADNLVALSADVGDIDNDGSKEVLIGGYDVDLESGTVNGSFYVVDATTLKVEHSYQVVPPEGQDVDVTDVASADVNGDGRQDAVLGYDFYVSKDGTNEPVMGKVLALDLTPDGDLKAVGSVKFPETFIVSVGTGDIDSDGVDEILVVTQSADGNLKLHLLTWGGDGLKEVGDGWSINPKYSSAYVQTFDIDGDGILEMMLTCLAYGEGGDHPSEITLYVYSYVPAKEDFRFEAKVDMTGEYSLPLPADVNGDGKMDVVVMTEKSDGIYLSLGEISNYVNPTGIVKGEVLDASGNPVPDAKVRIYPPRATIFTASTDTDEAGKFEVKKVPAGTYAVKAVWIDEAGGIHYGSAVVRVEAGKVVSVTVKEVKPQQPSTTTPPTTTQPTTPATTSQPTTSQTTHATTQVTTPATTTKPSTTQSASPHTAPKTTAQQPTTTAATHAGSPTSPSGEGGFPLTYVAVGAVIGVVIIGAALALRARRKAPAPYVPPPPPPPPA